MNYYEGKPCVGCAWLLVPDPAVDHLVFHVDGRLYHPACLPADAPEWMREQGRREVKSITRAGGAGDDGYLRQPPTGG